jgi:hypothetical protein
MKTTQRSSSKGFAPRIAKFFADNPNVEFHIDAIAKATNIGGKTVNGALTRLHKWDVVQMGGHRGYWRSGKNVQDNGFLEAYERGVNRRIPNYGGHVAASSSKPSTNGPTSIPAPIALDPPTATPQKARAAAAGLSDHDLMEVLRVRADGDVVLIAEDGELYVARQVHFD